MSFSRMELEGGIQPVLAATLQPAHHGMTRTIPFGSNRRKRLNQRAFRTILGQRGAALFRQLVAAVRRLRPKLRR